MDPRREGSWAVQFAAYRFATNQSRRNLGSSSGFAWCTRRRVFISLTRAARSPALRNPRPILLLLRQPEVAALSVTRYPDFGHEIMLAVPTKGESGLGGNIAEQRKSLPLY